MGCDAGQEGVARAELRELGREEREEPLHAQPQQRVRHVPKDANRRGRGLVIARHDKVVREQMIAAAEGHKLERVRGLVPAVTSKALVVERQYGPRTNHKGLKAFPDAQWPGLLPRAPDRLLLI